MRRLEERIAILEEDLGSEQHLRKRIEREKHDLQLQIIALSERLTESDAGAESQLDINRKREAEMAKLHGQRLPVQVHADFLACLLACLCVFLFKSALLPPPRRLCNLRVPGLTSRACCVMLIS